MGELAAAASVASAFGSFLGDEPGEQQTTGQSNSQSGFAALPPEVQQAYLKQYLPGILNLYNNKVNAGPLGEAGGGKWDSRALRELQSHSNAVGGLFDGTWGVKPIGQVEPLNQYQQNAIEGLGQNFTGGMDNFSNYLNPYSNQALNAYSQLAQNNQSNPYNPRYNARSLNNDVTEYGGYMKPFDDAVKNNTIRELQQQLQGGTNSVLGQNARLGSLGAFGSSALGTQLSNLQNAALDRYANVSTNLNRENYQQAVGLRNQDLSNLSNNYYNDQNQQNQNLGNLFNAGAQGQGLRRATLQDMLSAGNTLQGQNQNEANAANQFLQQRLPQGKLAQLAGFLGQIPGSSISNGQQFQQGPSTPNTLSKIGGLGMNLAGIGSGIGGFGF